VVIYLCIDCIGSHKSNYHMITTMAASGSNDLIGDSPSKIIFWQVMRKWNKIHKKNTTLLEVLKFNLNNSRNRNKMDTTSHLSQRPPWSWSYGSWIYDYLCNQCLSPLTLWVRISNMLDVLDTIPLCDEVCQWLVAGRWLPFWKF
jgi:hypothetical protein